VPATLYFTYDKRQLALRSGMRLVVERNQQALKGMLGGNKGVSFTLAYRLELTPEEQELVRQYKLESYPVTFHTVQGARLPDDTIASMMQGASQTLTDVTTLVRNESIVKDACDALPTLFEVVRTFGGREVIDYPRTGANSL
jgi:hypothetical protein